MELNDVVPAVDCLDEIIGRRFSDLDEVARGQFISNILFTIGECYEDPQVFRVEVHAWQRGQNRKPKGTIRELDPRSPNGNRTPGLLSQ